MAEIKPLQTVAASAATSTPNKTATTNADITSPITKKPAAKLAVTKPSSVKPMTKSTVTTKAKPKTSNIKKPTKKTIKKIKPEKIKMERDSFTMPKEEYAQITLMKARLTAMGQPAKKSELLRAGIKLLAAMSDNTLKITLAKIPVIKTGRPNKKS
jgi:hypothetical protein